MESTHLLQQNVHQGKMTQLRFGDSFFEDYAGKLVSNPNIAFIELISNAFDAGADKINIKWPDKPEEIFSIEDNGIGMTADQFEYRWLHLNYDRTKEQGSGVEFPADNRHSNRKAFGRNGKGRLSAFCFCDEYYVRTWQNSTCNFFIVKRNFDNKSIPYCIEILESEAKEGHGTKISGKIDQHFLDLDTIKSLLWSKFISDPTVEITVNGQQVELLSIEDHLESRIVSTPWGEVLVYFIPGEITGRTSLQNGIAWWVDKKRVGDISWERMSERGSFIDRRTTEGKRFTFIVQADILADCVEFDWTEFKRNDKKSRAILQKVEVKIEEWLRELTFFSKQEEKKLIINENREKISKLPKFSQELIGEFIGTAQDKIPTMGQEILSKTVSIFCNIEAARNGRELLFQLASLTPEDFDHLHDILQKWSVRDAKIVLDELHWRLELITQLENLVEKKSTLELQQLQPLFAKGLWIFGPEFEGCSFTSNRSINTVINSFLLPKIEGSVQPEMANKRPDFVVTPNSIVSSYARPGYDDETSEINGLEKVIIIELKRGGFEITINEIRQAEDYARAILKSSKVKRSKACISCFVLGTRVEELTGLIRSGDNEEIILRPWPYSTILAKAHARTYNLLKNLKEIRSDISYDPDVDKVLSSYYQEELDMIPKEG